MSAMEYNNTLDTLMEPLLLKLRTRQVHGSSAVALETTAILRQLVSQSKWASFDDLIKQLSQLAARIKKAVYGELISSNVILRVIELLREEYEPVADDSGARPSTPLAAVAAAEIRLDSINDKLRRKDLKTAPSSPSPLLNFFVDMNSRDGSNSPIGSWQQKVQPIADLKPAVISAIQDVIDDIEKMDADIAAQAVDHIHHDETIITYGANKTTESFFMAAARKRKFTIIICEDYPNNSKASQAMAKRLAGAGVESIVIPESNIFAIMSRAHKVILGAHLVLANGGCVASSGTRVLCQAAAHYSVPVVILTGLLRLTPLFPYDQEQVGQMGSAELIIPFKDSESKDAFDTVNTLNDYIDPDRIHLYITNQGGSLPSYMNRILAEYYQFGDTSY